MYRGPMLVPVTRGGPQPVVELCTLIVKPSTWGRVSITRTVAPSARIYRAIEAAQVWNRVDQFGIPVERASRSRDRKACFDQASRQVACHRLGGRVEHEVVRHADGILGADALHTRRSLPDRYAVFDERGGQRGRAGLQAPLFQDVAQHPSPLFGCRFGRQKPGEREGMDGGVRRYVDLLAEEGFMIPFSGCRRASRAGDGRVPSPAYEPRCCLGRYFFSAQASARDGASQCLQFVFPRRPTQFSDQPRARFRRCR